MWGTERGGGEEGALLWWSGAHLKVGFRRHSDDLEQMPPLSLSGAEQFLCYDEVKCR